MDLGFGQVGGVREKGMGSFGFRLRLCHFSRTFFEEKKEKSRGKKEEGFGEGCVIF